MAISEPAIVWAAFIAIAIVIIANITVIVLDMCGVLPR